MSFSDGQLRSAASTSVAVGLAEPPPFWGAKVLRQALQFALLVGLAFGFYYLISNYLLQSVRIVGVSMSPTLHDKESYLLNRWIYHLREPRRADVVVLKDPSDGGFSVKRVVAVAGDTVYIHDGILYVNGKAIREEYLPFRTPTYTEKSKDMIRCGPDEYFVLGDNRNNSVDSRKYGPVPRQNILGMILN